MYIANIPVVFIWLFFAIRARRLFFFSTVNPVIETGGVLGESKINILRRLPAHTIPTTIYITKSNSSISFNEVLDLVKKEEVIYPLIVKPNIGERGFMVKKIENREELLQYHETVSFDYLVQDFVDYPMEISVLYYRMPEGGRGDVTSICIKKNLSVTGDGSSTVEDLMQEYPRARFQLDRFRKDTPSVLKKVLAKNETLELEPIGNHSRGTTFLNGNHLIDDQIVTVFDNIGQQMEGIYYGRFDMKCTSIEELKSGNGIKILEFNGIASEPAHIYDPGYKVSKAYSDIYEHWKIIYSISLQQRNKGIKAMSIREAYTSIVDYLSYMRSAKVKL